MKKTTSEVGNGPVDKEENETETNDEEDEDYDEGADVMYSLQGRNVILVQNK